MDNTCVICGEIIPEGRQLCPKCEADRNARFDHAMGVKAKTVKKTGKLVGIIGAVIVILVSIVLTWLCMCGIVKAITLAFGWNFSLSWTTGIWLFLTVMAGIMGLVGHGK